MTPTPGALLRTRISGVGRYVPERVLTNHDLEQMVETSDAWIVERSGRDAIALEHTAEGFDIYLCDSPNGSAEYSLTLSIPRRGRR